MEFSTVHSTQGWQFQDWGLIDYRSALEAQLKLVDLVSGDQAQETLVFCSHFPVVTLGRATKDGDVHEWQGETVEVNRGGRATYHGPNQIVVYPIYKLDRCGRDVHRYMRLLEEAIILTLSEFGVIASGRKILESNHGSSKSKLQPQQQPQFQPQPQPEMGTGVWVGERKIASIGIGVRRWISFHGLALNVDHDPNAFRGLRPCGLSPATMTSLQEVLGYQVSRDQLKGKLTEKLVKILALLS